MRWLRYAEVERGAFECVDFYHMLRIQEAHRGLSNFDQPLFLSQPLIPVNTKIER